ncbi:MAG: hypothetical protein AAB420_01735 [Patescibacteria group bacterium]
MIPLHIGKARDLQNPGDRRWYRFFEILPGLFSWLTLIAVVVCSFFFPAETALFIIIFDIYWLVKTIYLSLHLRAGYNQTRRNMKINWLEKLQGSSFKFQDLYHFIILPTYQEPAELIRDSLLGLTKANYPQDRMIVVLAQEGRAGSTHNEAVRNALENEFRDSFFRFTIIEHPDGIEGEQAGKGANISWAGRQVQKEIIDALHIPYEDILVSIFDIDTVVFPEYFSRLTYVFLTSENRMRASYQPVPFFTNNIWEAPAFARVVAFGSTFWQTIQQARPENLITFSSHSMPFQAVVDIGFWQTNMVNEDSRVFWQCLLRYDGDYRVVPLHYPVSMDTNTGGSFWKTMVNVYKQHRRWSYGVENVPYFLLGFMKNKTIYFSRKLHYTITIFEGYWSWATNAIMLFLLGWLPGVLGGPEFNGSVLSFNHAQLSHTIMRLALLALLTPLILSLFILPPRPRHVGFLKYSWMLIQWILFPVTTIIFGSFPALDGQTRLMLGKYMGFWVTPKHRKPIQSEPSSEALPDEHEVKDSVKA